MIHPKGQLLTHEYMQELGFCEEGMLFAERNGLVGSPLDNLMRTRGDFMFFIAWVKAPPEITRDSQGRIVAELYHTGLQRHEYDSVGRRTLSRNADGATVLRGYEGGSRLPSTHTLTRPDGSVEVTRFERTPEGNVSVERTPDGRVYNYQYVTKPGVSFEVFRNGRRILKGPLGSMDK